MKIIRNRNKLTDVILPLQKVTSDRDWRFNLYVQCVENGKGFLLYHLMTGELLWTEDIDTDQAYLIKHYFLVSPDHGDYRLYKSFCKLYFTLSLQHAKNINSFTVFTTTDCNARCFYCYELGSKRESMSLETAEIAVRYIKRNADITRPVRLSWFGGEPLFNCDIIDQISLALSESGIEFSSSMISNGYLFDEGIVVRAVSLWKLKKVQITLDGTEEVYNKRKAYIYRDGISAFQKVMRSIVLLAKAGVDVNIRLNLDQNNQKDLLQLIEELDQTFHGCNKDGCGACTACTDGKMSVKEPQVTEGWADHISIYCHELFQCSEDEEIGALKKAVNQKIKTCGFYKQRYAPLGLKINHCMADSPESVIIMPDGSLQSCEHFNKHASIGTIFNNDNKKAAISYYRERLIEERCKTCPVLPQCIRLKHCPEIRCGCSDEMVKRKLKSIRESMLHYYEQYREENSDGQLSDDQMQEYGEGDC